MPAPRKPIPRHDELVAYNAVAGHDGTMCDPSGQLFVKPCTAAEIAFYEASQDTKYEEFRGLMPDFYGTLQLNNNAQDAMLHLVDGVSVPTFLHAESAKPENGLSSVSTSTSVSTTTSVAESTETTDTEVTSCITITVDDEHATEPMSQSQSQSQSQYQLSAPTSTVSTPKTEEWVPNGGKRIKTDTAIVLENTSHGFKHPNILDCKMGTRLWADDAPQKKKDRFDKIARTTTHRNYGFRIAGMRAWRGSDNSAELDQDDYMVYDRLHGRDHVTDDNLAANIRRFIFNKEAGISHELGQAVSAAFVAELKQVHDILSRHSLRMYSGSLLFIFEGHGPTLAQKIKDRARYVEELEARSQTANDNDDDDQEAALKAAMDQNRADMINGIELVQTASAEAELPQDSDDDDDDDEDDDEDDIPKTHSLRLIDFAHAKWVRAEDGPDLGMLLGVKSLIDIFQGFADEKEDPQVAATTATTPAVDAAEPLDIKEIEPVESPAQKQSLKQKALPELDSGKDAHDQLEQHRDKKRKLSCA